MKIQDKLNAFENIMTLFGTYLANVVNRICDRYIT